jgi:AcrR family transcriptional regulator
MSANLDATAVPSTPRERRRLQTRQEILDAALAVMADNGVAALNLTEVARRVGLRQPSLYQYFDARTAVYDALFERGMRAHLDVIATAIAQAAKGWAAARATSVATLRFAAENPVLAQLLFTRAVPGFVPSVEAYAPALRVYELTRATLAATVERGELHPAAASERGMALFVAITAGVASQRAANDPEAGDLLLEPALDMYAAYFNPDRPNDWTPWH